MISTPCCTYRNHFTIPQKRSQNNKQRSKQIKTKSRIKTKQKTTANIPNNKVKQKQHTSVPTLKIQAEILPGTCSEWWAGKAYIFCPHVAWVTWYHIIMQNCGSKQRKWWLDKHIWNVNEKQTYSPPTAYLLNQIWYIGVNDNAQIIKNLQPCLTSHMIRQTCMHPHTSKRM